MPKSKAAQPKAPVQVSAAEKHQSAKSPLPALLAIYGLTVLIRFVLALLTTINPMSNIDEFLYYGLARSIATKGELLFRGRVADYQYIFYPLVLSPVYMIFQEGAPFYRLLQLWNILLMSLSLFPIYGICRKLIGDQKKALLYAGLAMLAGDFILGEVIYSESIIYPMFFAAVYLTLCCLEHRSWGCSLGLGVLGALLYETKPGAVAFPVVALLILMIDGLRKKDKLSILQNLCGLLVGAAVIVLFQFLLKFAFHAGESGFLSLYEEQLGGTRGDLHLHLFFKGLPQYVYYLILSCGIVCFIVPILHLRSMDRNTRELFWMTLISLAIMIIGTVWTINRFEYATHAIHLRYIGMYIPLIMLFSLVSPDTPETDRKKAKKPEKSPVPWAAVGILAYVAVCALVWGLGGTENSTAMVQEVLSLPYSHKTILSDQLQRIAGCIVALAAAALCYAVIRNRFSRLLKVLPSLILVFLLCGNITSYVLISNSHQNMDGWEEPTAQAADVLKGENYLYVLTNDHYVAYSGLDVGTKTTPYYVKLNNFYNSLYQNNGCYVPYHPTDFLRGTKDGIDSPDVEYIVWDNTAFSMIKPSQYVTDLTPGNPLLHVLKIQKGAPVIDSILANVESNKLETSDPGILIIFNKEQLKGTLKVRMKIHADSQTGMQFFSGAETKTATLHPGTDWYEFEFASPQDAYNFTAESEIGILEYEISNE